MTGSATETALIQDVAQVEDFAGRCFRGSAGDQVGVELEFLVFDRADPALHVPADRIAAALPSPPGGSRVTFEPGGQFWAALFRDAVELALGPFDLGQRLYFL